MRPSPDLLRKALTPAVLALTLAGAASTRAESYVLVRVTDMLKDDTHQVMSATEFKDLQKTVQNEARYYVQAEQAAQKAWKEDEMNRHIPFPGARLSPRKVETKGQFSKKEEADAKLEQIEERETRKTDREAQTLIDLRKRNPHGGAFAKELQAKEDEKTADANRAHELVQEKLKELIEKAAVKTEPKSDTGVKPPAAEALKAVQKAL